MIALIQSYFSLDIDECFEEMDNCEIFCLNSNGSFSCYCDDDDVLANDDSHCLSMLTIAFALELASFFDRFS